MKFRILLLVTAAILAAGCTGTPELPHTPEHLAGTWRLVREEGQELTNGRKSSWVIEYNAVRYEPTGKTDSYDEIWTFGADDIRVETKGYEGQTLKTEYYDYECSGDTVVVYGPSRRRFADVCYRIENLTASQLVLTEKTDGVYGKVAWTLIYEKMKKIPNE